MESKRLFSLLSLLVIFHHQQIPAAGRYLATSPIAPTNAPAVATNGTEFIRTSCATTLYPDICYNSLSEYAATVRNDSARLARVAISLSLTRAKRMENYVSNLCRQSNYGSDKRAINALHDCASVFDEAVEQIRDSMREMKTLGKTAGLSMRFQMSNVQTYMSAALTNEDTCTDGFQDVGSGAMKTDICGRVVPVRQITSNALALVNNFVRNITPHY